MKNFAHHPDLPQWQDKGARLTLLAGTHDGRTAPTRLYSPLLGLDIASDDATALRLALNPDFEYGILPLVGEAGIEGETVRADQFAYLGRGRDALQLTLSAGARLLVLGGEPFAEPVLMWWNFVGWTKASIARAQADWEQGARGEPGSARFGPVGDGRAPRLIPPPLPWGASE